MPLVSGGAAAESSATVHSQANGSNVQRHRVRVLDSGRAGQGLGHCVGVAVNELDGLAGLGPALGFSHSEPGSNRAQRTTSPLFICYCPAQADAKAGPDHAGRVPNSNSTPLREAEVSTPLREAEVLDARPEPLRASGGDDRTTQAGRKCARAQDGVAEPRARRGADSGPGDHCPRTMRKGPHHARGVLRTNQWMSTHKGGSAEPRTRTGRGDEPLPTHNWGSRAKRERRGPRTGRDPRSRRGRRKEGSKM